MFLLTSRLCPGEACQVPAPNCCTPLLPDSNAADAGGKKRCVLACGLAGAAMMRGDASAALRGLNGLPPRSDGPWSRGVKLGRGALCGLAAVEPCMSDSTQLFFQSCWRNIDVMFGIC